MITKFKIFENVHVSPQEGYYVILNKPNRRYSDFLENNIATITKIYYPGSWFEVKFDNVPKELKQHFDNVQFNISEIKHISKNISVLEAIIQSKKYNL